MKKFLVVLFALVLVVSASLFNPHVTNAEKIMTCPYPTGGYTVGSFNVYNTGIQVIPGYGDTFPTYDWITFEVTYFTPGSAGLVVRLYDANGTFIDQHTVTSAHPSFTWGMVACDWYEFRVMSGSSGSASGNWFVEYN